MTDWQFAAGTGEPDIGTIHWTLPPELAEDLAALPEEEQRAMRKVADLTIERAMHLLIGVIYTRDKTVFEQFLIYTSDLGENHVRQMGKDKPNRLHHWRYGEKAVGYLLWTPEEPTQNRLNQSSEENKQAIDQLMKHLLGQFARLATIMLSSKRSRELILEHQKWTNEFLEKAVKTLD